jgi:hypothetical protein
VDEDDHESPPDRMTEAQADTRQARLRAPWDRSEGEPDHAFEVFTEWLHSGASVSAWARDTHRNAQSMLALSWRYSWQARRRAYTYHIHGITVAAAEQEAAEIGREHARAARLAREVATRTLEAATAAGKIVSIRDAAALMKLAVDLERLMAGDPTIRVGVTSDGRTMDQLREEARALAEAMGAIPVLVVDPNAE